MVRRNFKDSADRKRYHRIRKQVQRKRWGGATAVEGITKSLNAEADRLLAEAWVEQEAVEAEAVLERSRRSWERNPMHEEHQRQLAALDVLRRGPRAIS